MSRKYSSRLSRWMLVATCFSLASCQKNTETPLSFWAYQPSTQAHQNAFRALIADFTEQTGIQVKLNLVVKDSFNTALTSALSGRSKPDLSYLDQPLIADYASDGTLADLTSFMATSETLSPDAFYPSVYSTNVYEGKTYGVPLNMTSTVLFYNKALISQAPTTWADWLSVRGQLPSGKSLFDGIGNGGYAGWYFQSFLANCGGNLVNEGGTAVSFNDANGVAAATMIKQLYGNDTTSILNRGTSDAFGNGLVAFKMGSSSDIDRLDVNFPSLDYGVALMPSQTGETSFSNMGGENLVIFENSTRKNECQQLIEYLLQETSVKSLASFTGNFPAITAYADSSDTRKQIIVDQMANAVARPVLPNWIRVNDEYLGPALSDKILSDENPRDIQASLDTAAEAANMLLF